MPPVRPSPTASAAKFEEGARRKGNDGAMYEIRRASNGVKRWVRVAGAAQPACEVELTLKPSAGLVTDTETGDIKQLSMKHAIAKKAVTLGDFVSQRAALIVHTAVAGPLAAVDRIKGLAYDMVGEVYRVRVLCNDAAALCEEMRSHFGDSAADTWMEGDIMLTPACELHLSMVSCRAV